jgi:hypothetical protein
MSGAPEDSNSNLPPSGISRGTRAIIHWTVRCTPDSVRCAKEDQPQELASFGKLQRLVRYNSPDCPVCTGLSGATPEQRLHRANGYLRRIKCARSARRSQARPYWHTGQQTVTVRCAPDTQAGPQVRSSNGQNPTAVMTWQGAPDCPVCTGLSGATPEQRLVGANGYLRRIKCARSAPRSQARPYWHTGQQTVPVRCAPDTQAGPQVRSSNG